MGRNILTFDEIKSNGAKNGRVSSDEFRRIKKCFIFFIFFVAVIVVAAIIFL